LCVVLQKDGLATRWYAVTPFGPEVQHRLYMRESQEDRQAWLAEAEMVITPKAWPADELDPLYFEAAVLRGQSAVQHYLARHCDFIIADDEPGELSKGDDQNILQIAKRSGVH
jgi:hypothetical protein